MIKVQNWDARRVLEIVRSKLNFEEEIEWYHNAYYF